MSNGNGNRPALYLDQSTRAVGWCVAAGEHYMASGTYRPACKDAYERSCQIGTWLEQMLLDWQPALLVVEEPCGDHGNRRSDRLLGVVLGVALECARRAGLTLKLVHPMQVKRTGLSKDAPGLVAAWIGKKKVSTDEADAIGVWQAALAARRVSA